MSLAYLILEDISNLFRYEDFCTDFLLVPVIEKSIALCIFPGSVSGSPLLLRSSV